MFRAQIKYTFRFILDYQTVQGFKITLFLDVKTSYQKIKTKEKIVLYTL